MRITLITICVILALSTRIHAQAILNWENSYGGSLLDEGVDVTQTPDGGYIMLGHTKSNDGQVSGLHGQQDFWVVKTNDQNQIEWEKCLGGSNNEWAYELILSNDGGYLLAGETMSNDGDVSGNHGGTDSWIVKLDSAGNILWQKCYGGSHHEGAYCIRQTSDGGYIIGNWTWSNDGDVSGNHGNVDAWVFKIDSSGNLLWQKCYGGTHEEHARSIRELPNGHYIICGSTASNEGQVSGNHGIFDAWVWEIDQAGNLLWQKCYGGSEGDRMEDIHLLDDDGFIVAGGTRSNDGDVTGHIGYWDIWVLRLDSIGNIIWQRCYGGTDEDFTESIIYTLDREFVIPGRSNSIDGDVSGNHGEYDYWIFKIDEQGNFRWKQCLGGSDIDGANDITEISDDNYTVIGYAGSDDGDVSYSYGVLDYWLVNLSCDASPISIEAGSLEFCDSTILTATGGFEEYKWNTGDTAQSIIIDQGGMYSVTGYNTNNCMSNTEVFIPGQPDPYSDQELCMVTYDDNSGFNRLIYEPSLNEGVDSVFFYRFNNGTGSFDRIGSNSIYTEGVFIDFNADPNIRSQQYNLSILDTCGNQSELSPLHQTVFLQAGVGAGNEVNLSWSPYLGYDFEYYDVYRKGLGGDYIKLASIHDTNYVDSFPPLGQLHYIVRIEKDTPCNTGTSLYDITESNPTSVFIVKLEETLSEHFRVYPNPFGEELIISREPGNEQTNIELINVYGQVLGQYRMKPGQNNLRISTSHIVQGMYYLRFNEAHIKKILKY